MKSANLEKLYNYLINKDNFEFGYNYSDIIECTFNAEDALDINFNIMENNGIFNTHYEVCFANKVCHSDDVSVCLFDEATEEINKITSKALMLAETLESTVRDTF